MTFFRKFDPGDGKGPRMFYGDTLEELNAATEAALQAPLKEALRQHAEEKYQIKIVER